MASVAAHNLVPSIFRKNDNTLGFIHLKNTCAICREPPETGGATSEQWCVLACGHRFGHRCLRGLLADPELRHCPTCIAPATCACGHPVTPAALPRLKGPAGRLEMRRACRLLSRQADEQCAFCREHGEEHGDTVAVLAALDLDVDSLRIVTTEWQDYARGGARPPVPPELEESWSTWWSEESRKGPRRVRGCKDRVDYHNDICL